MWAISWTGFLLVDRVTSVATPSIVDLSARDLDRYTGLSVLSVVLQIAAAVFAIRLVRRVTAHQQRLLAAPPQAVPADPEAQAGSYAQASPYAQPGPYAQPRAQTPAAPYAQAPFPAEPYQPPAEHSPATVGTTPAPAPPPASSPPPAPEPPEALRPPSDPWPSAGF
jgi:hypothetical protein